MTTSDTHPDHSSLSLHSTLLSLLTFSDWGMGIRNRAIIITKAIIKKIPTFLNKRNAKARVRNVVQNRSRQHFERINSRNAVFIMNEFRNRDVTQTVLEPKRHCFKSGISRRGSKRYQYLCLKWFQMFWLLFRFCFFRGEGTKTKRKDYRRSCGCGRRYSAFYVIVCSQYMACFGNRID